MTNFHFWVVFSINLWTTNFVLWVACILSFLEAFNLDWSKFCFLVKFWNCWQIHLNEILYGLQNYFIHTSAAARSHLFLDFTGSLQCHAQGHSNFTKTGRGIWNCHLKTLSIWKSLKFVIWETLNYGSILNKSENATLLLWSKWPKSVFYFILFFGE